MIPSASLRARWRCLAACAVLPFVPTACRGDAGSDAPAAIRVSAIPDDSHARIEAIGDTLCAYLQEKVGIPFRYVRSSSYSAAANGPAAGTLDLVWVGGVTAVQADAALEGEAVFVATRDVDLHFRTYFVANREAIARGEVAPLERLADLKPLAGHLTFTFGDKGSTSGHVMPRHFLAEAGIDPGAFERFGYRPTGGHGATLAAVASGEVELGALNYLVWERASDETKAAAPVVHTTAAYVDYCWIAPPRLGQATIDGIRAALLALDPAVPGQKAILDAWGAGRFVRADKAAWNGIRAVVRQLGDAFFAK